MFLCVLVFPLMAEEKKTDCRMQFSLNSWSAFYKSGKGHGNITCDNGQKAAVKIRTHGGGVTFGKSKIVNGIGNFSKVNSINDLFGGYAESEAHAGASGSADAHAMWKGDVSLAISGTGTGWNLGVNFGKFKITRR
ncbi:MAG: hypothetical protein Q8P84_07240 [Deltaproteobacteria bacterium]|nr:hypothetical protein [Deltaproteobacteria bacterium]